MDDLDNLSEEDLQKLIGMGIIPDEQASLEDQIKQAQMVRNRSGPEGTYTRGMYVAASPLEHIAHAMEGIKAGKDLKNLRAQQQGLLEQQNQGRMSYLEALLGRLRMGRGKHSYSIKAPQMQDIQVDPSLVDTPEV